MKIGVDLGGTKIEAIVMNDLGNAIWRERIATPKSAYVDILMAIANLVNKAKNANGIALSQPIGIGTPGAIYIKDKQTDAVIKNSNTCALNGQPLLKDLKRALSCEVYIENDANCFALAETLSGAGTSLEDIPESVFGVILGTGVGGGLVIHKRLLAGRHHISGEWGHNALPDSMLSNLSKQEKHRLCYCGRHDCIETYLSGPGLAQSFALKFQKALGSKEIVSLMRQKDEQALLIWNNYLDQLAASLAQVINIFDPELIVLGGGMSLIGEIYPVLPERMQPYVFTENFSTPILPAALGDSAGVYGAAWLGG